MCADRQQRQAQAGWDSKEGRGRRQRQRRDIYTDIWKKDSTGREEGSFITGHSANGINQRRRRAKAPRVRYSK